jgi:hypothetical protein
MVVFARNSPVVSNFDFLFSVLLSNFGFLFFLLLSQNVGIVHLLDLCFEGCYGLLVPQPERDQTDARQVLDV